MRMRYLAGSSLFLLVGALTAQVEETKPYFALSSNRSVAPGERAMLQVNVRGVEKLQFRVYRVNDPVAFFRKLPDVHQFTGAMRAAPRARTPLERFNRWRAGVRERLRNIARRQFTSDSRAQIRQAMGQAPAPPRPAAAAAELPAAQDYAAIPLLNPQQVVKVWEQAVRPRERWLAASVPLELKDKGLYVIEATDGRRQAYTILSVANVAILTKTAPGRLLARVVDRQTGAGVANCPLLVMAPGGAELGRLTTGADGTADVRLQVEEREEIVVMVNRREDFAMAAPGAWNLSTSLEQRLMGYVYTDRPIYRPGHAVKFRAVLRTMAEERYELPPGSEATVTVTGGDGQQVYQKKQRISRYGTVHGDLTLPPEAATGYYGVRVEVGQGSAYGNFNVEEYRKPEYEVRVTAQQPRLVQGGAMKMTIEARYYYGEPVAGAKAAYAVHRRRDWMWRYAEEFDLEDNEEGGPGYGSEEIFEKSGVLDAQGRLVVEIPTEGADFPMRYVVSARVTDSGQREIAGAGSFLATPGAYYLDGRPDRWMYAPGDTAHIRVEAKDWDGKPVAAGFRAELTRWDWQQGRGPVVQTAEGRTDAGGRGSVEMSVPEAGPWIVRLRGEGRVFDDVHLWVSGGGGRWSTSGRETVQMIVEKTSYKPGETAKVMIAPGAAEADLWVTVEGKTLYSSRVTAVKGAPAVIEVPVTSAHAPNFFVTASYVRAGALHTGTKLVKVPPAEQTLQVKLTPQRREFKPGEPAVYSVEARDARGAPAAAEFSLGVVDESIYALQREWQSDIVKVFYGRTWNRIASGSSFDYYFSGEAGTRRMELARLRRPRALGQLKPERPEEPRVRKQFPDTAFWVADLETDKNGRAEVRFAFPDSLTTWRATARGVTADTKVGGAVEKVIVRKNVLVALAAPRFLTAGDEISVPLMVRNYLPREVQAKVTLEARGVTLLDGAAREVTVAAKGEAKLIYRLKAAAAGDAVVLAKALAAEESDALELTIPVVPYGVKLAEAKSGALEAGGKTVETLDFPAPAPADRTLEVRLTPSPAGALFAALEYLSSYPYGCVEQTMSSFVPNIAVTQAVAKLGVKAGIERKELARRVEAGLKRLAAFQHATGAWGWWHEDPDDLFMTAYVLDGLKLARNAGYVVDNEMVDRGRQALEGLLEKTPAAQADKRAYALAVLARLGAAVQPPELETLSAYGVAAAGLAFPAAAPQAVARLEGLAQREGGLVCWRSARDPMLDFDTDASFEATAGAVQLLARYKPESPLIAPAIEWLLGHRTQGWWWDSTKQTALVVLALTDFVARSGEMKPDYRVTVRVNGKEALSRRMTAEDAFQAKPLGVRLPGAAANRVEIETSGTGKLYWSLRGEWYAGEERIRRGSGERRTIERAYFKLSPVESGGKVTYERKPVEGALKVGDLVLVELTARGDLGRYLLVEDPLPAGAEAVTRDGGYHIQGVPPWWLYWSSRRELRDQRAAFFDFWPGRGERRYGYLFRVTHAGMFRVAPARVEPMYEPGAVAAGGAATLEVRP